MTAAKETLAPQHVDAVKRPQLVAPVFDQLSLTQPLPPYDDEKFRACYGVSSCSAVDHYEAVASFPQAQEPYLVPMLTRNERIRLTTLWYHTKGLTSEPATLQRMQDKVNIVKALIGWEYAICGILDSDVFERVVTVGLPLAILPRRESTCSHTVLQPPGRVHFLGDMSSDARFKNSPHVSKGGLRSYAGTQLRCTAGTDEDVVLGSLCVASDSANMQLSTEQSALLTKFASMLSDDIINASQQRRAKQQATNDTLLQQAISKLPRDLDEVAVMEMLRLVFPNHHIALLPVIHNHLVLAPGGPRIAQNRAIACQVWEDDAAIEEFLHRSNHNRSKTVDTLIRAVLSNVRAADEDRALVVGTQDICQIYDDVDIRFVNSCALLLSNIAKEESLQAALTAQENFMRNITHHLRTPIHGILASAELLHSELATVNAKNNLTFSSTGTAWETIDMIKDSGSQLLRFANNMIRYNHWSNTPSIAASTTIVDMDTFESQILQHIPWDAVKSHMENTCVYFERHMPEDGLALVLADDSLIRDCLQPLLFNALQNTTTGSVSLTYTVTDDLSSIVFDVRDTGCGIASADQPNVFKTYEKMNFANGSGLGLSLARRAAEAFGGTVTLVSSQPGEHSHFRALLRQQAFACPRDRVHGLRPPTNLPQHYYLVDSQPPSMSTAMFARYLEKLGMSQSDDMEGALAILAYDRDAQVLNERLERASGALITVSLVPKRSQVEQWKEKYPATLFFKCPFTSARLREIVSLVGDASHSARSKQDVYHGPLTDNTIPASRAGLLLQHSPNMLRPSELQCLLVDDNNINLRILCAFCGQRDFPYKTAKDGLEAIEQYKKAAAERPIALILLDLQMPKCSGIDACKAIRTFEKERSLAPAVIIMVTGQDTPQDRQDATNAGADDYFTKPLVLKGLDTTIRQHFDLLDDDHLCS